jgi:hypothetical protein
VTGGGEPEKQSTRALGAEFNGRLSWSYLPIVIRGLNWIVKEVEDSTGKLDLKPFEKHFEIAVWGPEGRIGVPRIKFSRRNQSAGGRSQEREVMSDE